MDTKNSFFLLMDELKKTMNEKAISEELHNKFVLFVYTLYNTFLHYVIKSMYNVHYFIQTYLPLPKINSI